jgi:hypothetical protein
MSWSVLSSRHATGSEFHDAHQLDLITRVLAIAVALLGLTVISAGTARAGLPRVAAVAL